MLAEHDALDRCVSIEPRRREDQHADLRLLFADRGWLHSPAGERLLDAFARHPAVAAAQRHRSALVLRFDDAALAALEGRLAEGEGVGLDAAHLLAGQRFMVSFVGANTNKALHVGHLRNVFLGQALACALACAGAEVERHSLVGDIGRRVCEAMGGYLACHDGESPEALGLAGDRFVELCYRDRPGGQAHADEVEQVDDPNAEERSVRGDLADALMHAWLREGPSERELWRRMRDWALAGQRQTLARLGVTIDRYDCESAEIERAHALIARGLETNLFRREEAGGVIYETGRPEYRTMVLLREDGVPTEYARLLGLYDLILEDLPAGARFVEVVGIEWRPAALALGELFAALGHDPRDERYGWLFHGSITADGQKMGSSTGEVTWIDGLLDELAASPAADALEELAGGAVDRHRIADMLVRGAFLCAPTAQSLAFSLERLVEDRSSPGWTIARAWCGAQRTGRVGGDGPLARTAVVQSQLYRRSLARALARRDPAVLASYALGLCEACLLTPSRGPAWVTILAAPLAALGFPVGAELGAHERTAGVRAR